MCTQLTGHGPFAHAQDGGPSLAGFIDNSSLFIVSLHIHQIKVLHCIRNYNVICDNVRVNALSATPQTGSRPIHLQDAARLVFEIRRALPSPTTTCGESEQRASLSEAGVATAEQHGELSIVEVRSGSGPPTYKWRGSDWRTRQQAHNGGKTIVCTVLGRQPV